MKRSKRAARRRWGLGKALGLMVLAGTLAFLFSGKLPAAALPEEPADENGVFRQPVRVLHHPAEWAGESDATAPEEKTDQTAPVETPRMPELPVEEPAEAEEDVSVVVPQSEPVGMEHFSDAVFLGDSRTEGLYLYGNMTEGEFLYAVGATVESVFTKPTQTTEAGKVPMLDALANMECGKVYIMLGVNELGWPRTETFRDQYGKLIDRVREDHPDAQVVIQSILPVSAAQDAKGTYVNNRRIQEFNDVLRELAEEKNCPYLDVAEAVTGEDGCLLPELTSDGVHLNTKGCAAWRDYLMSHPVTKTL